MTLTTRVLVALALLVGGLGAAGPAQAAQAAPAAPSAATEVALAPGTALNLATGEVTSAAIVAYPCIGAKLCLYNTTLTIPYSISETTTGCRDLPSSIDNKTSYIINNTYWSWTVWLTGGCISSSSTIYSRSSGAMNSTWNNTISAYRRN
jgi:hypothetical protein